MTKDIQSIEYDLPLSYDFLLPSFYVRECYKDYYNLIQQHPLKYTTVTGTSGIGTSVFYIYFFQRYRIEHSQQTIVTASFIDGNLQRCIVFEPGCVEGVRHSTIPFYEDCDDFLHLYDGPPRVPPQSNRMICFTSPNAVWSKSIRKASNHRSLYMPVWTCDELLLANTSLNIGLEGSEIEKRFLFFGGSARDCLYTANRHYNKAVDYILGQVRRFDSYESVKMYLQDERNDFSHNVFHYIPEYLKGFPFFYKLDFCSKEIATRVDANIDEKSEQKRQTLIRYLHGNSKLIAILRWLYKCECK